MRTADSVSDKTLVRVLMGLVAHYVKTELVQFIVKMGESARCPEISANVEMASMDQGAIRGNVEQCFLLRFIPQLILLVNEFQ